MIWHIGCNFSQVPISPWNWRNYIIFFETFHLSPSLWQKHWIYIFNKNLECSLSLSKVGHITLYSVIYNKLYMVELETLLILTQFRAVRRTELLYNRTGTVLF